MIIRFVIIYLIVHISGVSMATEIVTKSAHDFTFKTIDGENLPLSSFSGKAILIVNTASRCGFTRQYSALQSLWQRYEGKGLIVLGVPSDDFGGQEPGTETDIKEFCKVNFNISFPLTKKTKVKGSFAHPFYRWAAKELGIVAKPRWNFHKYLVDPDGQLANWFSTPTSPLSSKVIQAIETNLP